MTILLHHGGVSVSQIGHAQTEKVSPMAHKASIYIAVLVIFTLVFFVLTSLQKVIVYSGNGKRK